MRRSSRITVFLSSAGGIQYEKGLKWTAITLVGLDMRTVRETLDICRAEKLSAWMEGMNFSIDEVRRALDVVENSQTLQSIPVDLARLMDLVRRNQLGPVLERVRVEGTEFPESSRLYKFADWAGTKAMIEAILARNWPATYDAGVSLGMDADVIEDAYNPVTVENIIWTMSSYGYSKYIDSDGEIQEITTEGEKPDKLLRGSIKECLAVGVMGMEGQQQKRVDVRRLESMARRDQMKRITDYVCKALKEEIPKEMGYPEGHRLYEFSVAIASRVRILSRLGVEDPRYTGFQIGLFRLVTAVVASPTSVLAWDAKVVDEMCEFFGIARPDQWIVWMSEITWVLWETGNAKFVDLDGKKKDAHEELKTRPSDDVKASIEKFITECLV